MSANIIGTVLSESRRRSKATKDIEKSGLFYLIAGLASCMGGALFAESVVGSEGWHYSGSYLLCFGFAIQVCNYGFHLLYKVREYKLRLAEKEARLREYEGHLIHVPKPEREPAEDPGKAEFIIFAGKELENGAIEWTDRTVVVDPANWRQWLDKHPPQTEDEYQKLRDCLKGKDGKAWTDCRLELLNYKKAI